MALTWHLLSETPWYIYVLFFFLINRGIKSSRTQIVSLKKLFVLPILFTTLSVHTLVTSVSFNYVNLASLLIPLLLAAGLGWWQVTRYSIEVDKEKWLIKVPGNWSTLVIILIVFASKYYLNYQLAVHPQILGESGFASSLLAITGFCTGFFIGRLACYIQRFIKLPSVELSQT